MLSINFSSNKLCSQGIFACRWCSFWQELIQKSFKIRRESNLLKLDKKSTFYLVYAKSKFLQGRRWSCHINGTLDYYSKKFPLLCLELAPHKISKLLYMDMHPEKHAFSTRVNYFLFFFTMYCALLYSNFIVAFSAMPFSHLLRP